MKAEPKFVIYKPARTAMQSGVAQTRHWVLRPDSDGIVGGMFINPTYGIIGSSNMASQQLSLKFETLEEAVRYAKSKGLKYRIEEQGKEYKTPPKSYLKNFQDKVKK